MWNPLAVLVSSLVSVLTQERLTSELHELMPGTSWCLEVIALAHRKHGAFMGAAQTGLVEHQIWRLGPTRSDSVFM